MEAVPPYSTDLNIASGSWWWQRIARHEFCFTSCINEMKIYLTGNPGLYLKFEISAGYLGGSRYQKSLNDPEWLQHTLAWYCSDFSFNSPDFYQPVLDQLKTQVLILRRLVLGEGVVHVEPIEFDLLQSEGAVDENPEKRTCYFLCERCILYWYWVVRRCLR